MSQAVVIKIGGHELDDESFLAALAQFIQSFETPVVIVHGGGKEISDLQTSMGITPQYIDGVRVTDPASLALVEMVLCGLVNKRLVRHLVAGGVDALGLSGIDRGLIRARKMALSDVDMGFTGEAQEVRAEILLDLLAQQITPVIAPVCLGPDSAYNVNADHVAAAVAAAIGASRVIFLTNVEGVLLNGTVILTLTPARVERLIHDGTIFGGMIPKVKMALGVLERGVPQAVVTNLAGLRSHGGTVFIPVPVEM